MIGPGGLLLVVPHIFAVLVSVLWVGFLKKHLTKLECENEFTRSHTEDPVDILVSTKFVRGFLSLNVIVSYTMAHGYISSTLHVP